MDSDYKFVQQSQPQGFIPPNPTAIHHYPLFKQVGGHQGGPAAAPVPQANHQVESSPKQVAEVVLIERTPPPHPDILKQPNEAVPAQKGEERPKLHHLTRHWLVPEARGGAAMESLGCATPKAAEVLIKYVLILRRCITTYISENAVWLCWFSSKSLFFFFWIILLALEGLTLFCFFPSLIYFPPSAAGE